MRDSSGDKTAGQSLAREVDQLCREQHQTKMENAGKSSAKDFSPNSKNEQPRSDTRDQRQVDQQNSREQQRTVEQCREQQRAQQREQQRTEQREQQIKDQQVKDQSKPADGKFQPSMLDGRNWQKDADGNFVTRTKDGRLMTADANGKMVDYQSQMNQKHMANQDQMAFTSILFCNPLMMLGMGAALTMMDQSHAAKSAKMAEGLNQKFDGKQANAKSAQSGYASDLSRKALLIAQYTRPIEAREVSQMNGMAGLSAASASREREELKKRQERKQRIEDRGKRAETKVSMPSDRYNMTTKKLMKTKKLIEDEIEKVRGKASLEEVSRLYAQVEVLDKALKRMANL